MTTKQEIQEAVERIMENGIDGIVTAVAERTADELAKAGVDCESEDSIQHCLLMGIRAAMRDLYLAREHFSTAAIVAGKAELERAALKAYDNDNEAAVTFLKMTKQAVRAPPKQQKQKQPEQAKPVNDLERRDTVRCSPPNVSIAMDGARKRLYAVMATKRDPRPVAGDILTEMQNVRISLDEKSAIKDLLAHHVGAYLVAQLPRDAWEVDINSARSDAYRWVDRKARTIQLIKALAA